MKIGTVRGIPVYIHWTFWLIILFYLFSASVNFGLAAGLYAVGFILSVFACVVLHEFGHAAAAGYYGIGTVDITVLPIGGLARLKQLPEKPVQELVIALAGPAVNAVIAGVLALLIVAGLSIGGGAPFVGAEMDFMAQLLAANIILAVFNLLPAFPMDGGRVLRGLLAMRTTHLRATQIAARVGRWMAFLFLIAAFTSGPWTLSLVAAFIFFAGTAELLNVQFREAAAQQQQAFNQQQPPGGWYTQVWPSGGSYYDAATEVDLGQGDVIDAVEVRQIDR